MKNELNIVKHLQNQYIEIAEKRISEIEKKDFYSKSDALGIAIHRIEEYYGGSGSDREWFKNIWINDNVDEEDFEIYFTNYGNNWFTEFKKFYEYCNVNKEYIGCKQELTEKQWEILVWNMAFVHADLTK